MEKFHLILDLTEKEYNKKDFKVVHKEKLPILPTKENKQKIKLLAQTYQVLRCNTIVINDNTDCLMLSLLIAAIYNTTKSFPYIGKVTWNKKEGIYQVTNILNLQNVSMFLRFN